MKKIAALLLALVLLCACAQAASPSIRAKDITQPKVKAQTPAKTQAPAAEPALGLADVFSALEDQAVTVYEAAGKLAGVDILPDEGFRITLQVLKPQHALYALLEEIAAFVQQDSIAAYLGGDAMAAALTLLPENADPEALVLDELFALTTEGYDPAWGDIRALFEFVTQYAPADVLLAAALLPARDIEAQPAWLPLQAAVEEGRVWVDLPQTLLEQAGEECVAFALLRLEDRAAE